MSNTREAVRHPAGAAGFDRPLRIAVVTGEPAFLSQLEAMLGHLPCEAVTERWHLADEGRTVVPEIAADAPDLYVFDHCSLGEPVLRAVFELRRGGLPDAVPILLVADREAIATHKQALLVGCTDLLLVPTHVSEVFARLATHARLAAWSGVGMASFRAADSADGLAESHLPGEHPAGEFAPDMGLRGATPDMAGGPAPRRVLH